MEKAAIEKIERIFKRYKLLRSNNPDTHIAHCVKQETLKNAIKIAAEAVNHNGLIHGHQRRVGRQKLNSFADKLMLKEKDFKNAKSFDQIHDIVKVIISEKIGELAIYDTAHRIGCYLNIFPDKIYLHSGTRTGARNLFGKLNKKQYLEIKDLPCVFQASNLSASEIEDVFCIYKDEFKNLN